MSLLKNICEALDERVLLAEQHQVHIEPGIDPKLTQTFRKNLGEAEAMFEKHGIHGLMNCPIYFKRRHVYDGVEYGGGYFYQEDYLVISQNNYSPGTGYGQFLVHEFGHRFDWISSRRFDFRERTTEAYHYALEHDESWFPSEYAKTNEREFWAECFMRYMYGRLTNPEVKEWTAGMVKQYAAMTNFG
jgi:hypothetical protein